jgi:hypothetical protein
VLIEHRHLVLVKPCTPCQSREQILKIHSRKMNLMRGINLRKIAEKMPNASGAECKVWTPSVARGFPRVALMPVLLYRACARKRACLR